jgi:thioredoxin reductase (NADPH)
MANDDDNTRPLEPDWDVLIVGASYSGLSAALTLGRCRRSVLVVGSGGARNGMVTHTHGLLTRDGATPDELLASAMADVTAYPTVEIVDDRVTAIAAMRDTGDTGDTGEGAGVGFRATLGKRTTTARYVILATGVNDNPPDIGGLAEHWGLGVFTCPFCDGYEHADQALAVVGDPVWSSHTATMLTGWSADVRLFSAGLDPDARAGLEAKGVVVDERSVSRIVGDGTSVSGVALEDGTTVQVGAVFCAGMPTPNAALATSLGCEVNEHGFVVVDAMRRTTVDGVWAVGDVTSMMHQMVIGMADGVMAGAQVQGMLISG